LKVKIFTSYFFEALLAAIALFILFLLKIDLQKTIFLLSQKLGIVFTMYGALIALCGGLLFIMINEPDTEFIKWLVKKRAESSYRNAAMYTLCSLCFGMIFIGINNIYMNSFGLSVVAIYLVLLNTIQILTMFILINNYISLKRKWQDLH